MKILPVLMCFPLFLFAVEPVPVAPENVLFLAHYDQSTEPAAGNTENSRCPAQITRDGAGFPFKNGGRQEALDLNGRDKFHLLPAEGNYDPRTGTIQMWIQPRWPAGADQRVFFQVVPTAEKWSSFNWEYFHLRKRAGAELFACDGRTKKEIPVARERSDGWIQLAVTWDAGKGVRRFYVNGKPAEEGKPGSRDSFMPEQIMIGGPKGWLAQSLADEVRILNIALTPEQILQDFQANMEGKPFPSPPAAASVLRTYAPEEVQPESAVFSVETDAAESALARPLSEDFQVDGDLDKAVWKNTEAVTDFRTIRGAELKSRTEIRFLYSRTALYIGAVCFQEMSGLVARFDQDEQPLWEDDDLEFFLDIPGRGRGFYQLAVNPLGCLTDFKDGKKNFQLRGREIAARRLSDRWELELKIPFSAFEMARPFPGDYIGFRICRAIHDPSESGAFPKLNEPGNNRRTRIGKLIFGSASESASAFRIRTEKNTFLPGVNTCEAVLENPGEKDFTGCLTVQAQNRAGEWSRITQVPLMVGAGEKVKVTLKIPVSDCGIGRIALVASDPSGEAGQALLTPGFVYAAPGAEKMTGEVIRLKQSMAFMEDADHPVYRAAFVSMDRILEKLSGFRTKLEEALKNGTTVPAEECRETAAHIAGFQSYVNRNRFLVWQTSPWENGSPDVLPPSSLNTASPLRLAFQQAGNEREAVCLVISGLLCGNAMDLRVAPRSITKNGTYIYQDNFEVFTEEFRTSSGETVSGPLIRSSGNYLRVAPGKAVRVWIVFNSRGVPPGEYETEIQIKPAYDRSVVPQSISVSLKVWNFALPETHEWPLQSFFWGPDTFVYDEAEALRLFHDYHMTHGWTEGWHYRGGFGANRRLNRLPKGESFREELVKTANQKFFDTAKELKMKFVFGWCLPSDIRWYELMAERMEKMGFTPREYVFKALIRDEFVKKHIPAEAAIRQQVADLKKDWWFQAVYLSTPPPTGATMDDIEEAKLPEFFKFWTVISSLILDPKRGPDVFRRLKSKGCEVWSYRCSLFMDRQSVLDYYRFHPWKCFLLGLDGVAWWDAMEPHGPDYFDHEDGYDDGITLCGTDRKPVPTKMLQAVREGLEDVAYMDRLQKELKRVGSQGKSFPEYEKLLADREGILERSNQAEVDDWRLKAGQAIDRLTRE